MRYCHTSIRIAKIKDKHTKPNQKNQTIPNVEDAEN